MCPAPISLRRRSSTRFVGAFTAILNATPRMSIVILVLPSRPLPQVDHTWIPEGWTDMSADAGGLDLDVEPLDLPTGSSIALSSAQDDEVMMLQFSSLPGME